MTTGQSRQGLVWFTAEWQEEQVSKSVCRSKGCRREKQKSGVSPVCGLSKDSTAITGCRRQRILEGE